MLDGILQGVELLIKRVIALAVLLSCTYSSRAQSAFIFRFADVQTGVRVIPDQVLLTLRGEEKKTYLLTRSQISDSGTTKLNVQDGTYNIEVNAVGYKTITTWFEMNRKELKVNFKLDRLFPEPQLMPDHIGKFRRKDATVVTGIVINEVTGLPMPGVVVSSLDKIAQTTTDSTGHYLLQLPLALNEQEIEQRGTLIFSMNGCTTEIRSRFDMWPNGDLILPVRMRIGSGENKVDVIEKREIHREMAQP